ncbi:hypothetical protein B0H16DRAFT_1456327 [Mycena metata]|uniref:Uncharacterized protein n=1 Tax=Mycena metata TaxID=1033252 RepID=A0AAD7JD88_9AGAR|nr:hypothetical protein B0H16DRAFT_1456327 [Mycena metata]
MDFKTRVDAISNDRAMIEQWYAKMGKTPCQRCETYKGKRDEPPCALASTGSAACAVCRKRKIACPYTKDYIRASTKKNFFVDDNSAFEAAYRALIARDQRHSATGVQVVTINSGNVSTGFEGGSITSEVARFIPVAPVPMPYEDPYTAQDLNSLDRDALINLLSARQDEMRTLRGYLFPLQRDDPDCISDKMHRLLAMGVYEGQPPYGVQVVPPSQLLCATNLHMIYIIHERMICLRAALRLEPEEIVAASLAVVSQVEDDISLMTQEVDNWRDLYGSGH